MGKTGQGEIQTEMNILKFHWLCWRMRMQLMLDPFFPARGLVPRSAAKSEEKTGPELDYPRPCPWMVQFLTSPFSCRMVIPPYLVTNAILFLFGPSIEANLLPSLGSLQVLTGRLKCTFQCCSQLLAEIGLQIPLFGIR